MSLFHRATSTAAPRRGRRKDAAPYLASAEPLPARDDRPALYPTNAPLIDITPEELDAIRDRMEASLARIAAKDLLDEHTAPQVATFARTAYANADALLTERYRRAQRYIAAEKRSCISYRTELEQELTCVAGPRRAAALLEQARAAVEHADDPYNTGADAAAIEREGVPR